jgi:hypothetical protein
MTSISLTPSSHPPGARSSFRTTPVTRIEDSSGRRSRVSKVSGLTSLIEATHCRKPVPSRRTMNRIFPDERRCCSQPLSVTVSPSRPGSSLM